MKATTVEPAELVPQTAGQPPDLPCGPPERVLVAALRQGSGQAFDAVYDRYRSRIYGFLLRLSGSRAVADDLFQETWLRLARHAMRLRPDTELGAWLFAVARNCYRSYRRWALLDQQRLREHGLALWHGDGGGGGSGSQGNGGSPFDRTAARETEARLEAALRRLPLKYREALLLCGVEGMAPEQAAATLSISPENLRQRLRRGRVMVRERLREQAAAVSEASARG